MSPTLPTPHETAQWVMETHLEHLAGHLTDNEHNEIVGHLSAAYDEMTTVELKRALGAMTDIADELTTELALHGVDHTRVHHLIRRGNGRLHVTPPRPTDSLIFGLVPAMRLAQRIARWWLQVHLVMHNKDNSVLDAYRDAYDDLRTEIAGRSIGQLVLVVDALRTFSATFDRVGADGIVRPFPETPTTVAKCEGRIDGWGFVIDRQSRSLHTSTGSMDHSWALHYEFFGAP